MMGCFFLFLGATAVFVVSVANNENLKKIQADLDALSIDVQNNAQTLAAIQNIVLEIQANFSGN